jgi:hypothetical protein
LNAQVPQGASAVPLLIGYDPAALKVVKVTEGDLATQGAQPATVTSTVDEASGQIAVEWTPPETEGAVGKGSLVSVTFAVTAEKPKTQISVATAVPAPAGKAVPLALPGPHQVTLTP